MSPSFESFELPPPPPKRFHPQPGDPVRIAFLWEDEVNVFKGAQVHFIKNRPVICTKGKCCQSGRPFWRFGVPIIRYWPAHVSSDQVSRSGEPFEVMPWIFGQGVYNQIKAIPDVQTHDLSIHTEILNEFKNITVTPCKKSDWKKERALTRESILQQMKAIWEDLPGMLGAILSDSEIEALSVVDTGLKPPVPEAPVKIEDLPLISPPRRIVWRV
jgi:hypothetical protein